MHVLEFDMHAGEFVALAQDDVLLVELPQAGRPADHQRAKRAHPEARPVRMTAQQGHQSQDDGDGKDHRGRRRDRGLDPCIFADAEHGGTLADLELT
jgi:hypothetical protein